MKTILLFFCTFSCFSQKLHHQIISTQAAVKHTLEGITIRQIVGQQSALGNYVDSNFIIGQGFFQSDSVESINTPIISITTTTYPNPFVDKINFRFSTPLTGVVKFSLFDISGRLVYYKEKLATENTFTIDNLFFSQGEYLVRLSAKNYNYTTNLLKY